MTRLFATTSVLALLLAGPALAQAPASQGGDIGTTAPPAATATDRNRTPAAGATGAAAPAAAVFPMAANVEKFIGKDVYGMQGNGIGRIENVLIGPEGRVRAAIVEFGGLLGTGENKVAVPWERLNITGDRIMVSIPEEQIKAEPRWTRDRPGAFAELHPYR